MLAAACSEVCAVALVLFCDCLSLSFVGVGQKPRRTVALKAGERPALHIFLHFYRPIVAVLGANGRTGALIVEAGCHGAAATICCSASHTTPTFLMKFAAPYHLSPPVGSD